MTQVAPGLMTVEDYMAIPDESATHQLIQGTLQMSPPPNRYHQDISRNIQFILLKYIDSHPIGVVYDAPFGVFLSEIDAFQPDLVFLSNERRHLLSARGIEGAPDLVIEILSPSTAQLDRGAKRAIYALKGVKELWLIDPPRQQISIYRFAENAEKPTAVYGTRDKFTSPLFPGLVFRGQDVFATYPAF